jgi:hypothetical protein
MAAKAEDSKAPSTPPVPQAKVLYAFTREADTELSVEKNVIVYVLKFVLDFLLPLLSFICRGLIFSAGRNLIGHIA